MPSCVIGAGAFGTALATVLAQNGNNVRLWTRSREHAAAIEAQRENAAYLPGVVLAPAIEATADLEWALAGAERVVCAIPVQATRAVMQSAAPFLPSQVPIVSVAKGIENTTLLTVTELLEDCLPEVHHPYLAALSGPSFAEELARRMPTAVTIASHREKIATLWQSAFQTDTFRLYTSGDVVGVQLGGALKNVIAIAAGISDGLGFGHNARAALVTRGLAEMTRLAMAKGANPLTLSGLSGIGDLMLTCTSELSRNRRVGFELGKGKPLRTVLKETRQIAEGVKTAESARGLARKLGVELPICEQVCAVASEGKNPRAAFIELMRRLPKPEL
jgi:glycerol-3-phosphate dehydrogenase (NAD(P)+)